MNAQDIIKKYRLDHSTWTNKGFHGVLHTFFPVGENPLLPLRKHFGDSYGITVVFFKEDYGNWYWNDGDMERLRNLFIEKVMKRRAFLDEWKLLWKQLLVKLVRLYKRCDIDLTKLSDDKLLELYKRFYSAYIEQYGVAIGIQDAFSMHADRFLIPALRKALIERGREKDCNKAIQILTTPTHRSFVTQEYTERLHIIKKIKGNKRLFEAFSRGKSEALAQLSRVYSLRTVLENHSKRWFWIENNYAKQKVLGVDYFIEKICGEISLGRDPQQELLRIDRMLKNSVIVKKRLLAELSFDKKIKVLLHITDVFGYMQDERKKHVLIANSYQRRFFEEIGRRVGLSPQEMEYTIIHEMDDVLIRRRFDRKTLASRRKHCVCIQTPEGYEILDGPVVQELFDTLFAPKTDVSVLHGLCASQGKARGVVKVVRKVHDLANVQKGDILVASMTRPEMVVAMEKAAAIVTDEGGITSHAAIVSRELGVPCVIGTKNATSVLKTGDLVEVDATKGVVKKVK